MEYIDVLWRHPYPGEPFRLVSELNEQRNEVRKLEFFADGLIGYATEESASKNTRLSTVPIPSLEAINEDPQFCGTVLIGEEFEALWKLHAGIDA